ncbi:uncharacterized protein LOC106463599 [Limulus polyphemus]|uniref:Uncharacterized protein LOC106463599 n=1 Tax=Limulus polyphemus TaxID=6850 RepID=A0ABM1BC89_LIMPO|nr:uncharacterized protein LOC106463599 [Limulus polyphemus]
MMACIEKDVALKTGFLCIAPQRQGILKKSWSKRYIALYQTSINGIRRLEIFDRENNFLRQTPSKIIPLTDCIKVMPASQKQQANVFEVRTIHHTYTLSAETFQEMMDWVSSIQEVAFGLSSNSSTEVSSFSNTFQESTEEENLLYASINAPEVYQVKVVESEAANRCGLQGNYLLIVKSASVYLAEQGQLGSIGKTIQTWPYRYIRRYGKTPKGFCFEAGRRCQSGEGQFYFETIHGLAIFQSITAHMSALKSSPSESDSQHSPSPGPESGNNSFNLWQPPPSIEDSKLTSEVNNQKCILDCPNSLLNKKDDFFNYSALELPTLAKDLKTLTIDKPPNLKPRPPVSKPPRKSKLNNNNKFSFEESLMVPSRHSIVPEGQYEQPIQLKKISDTLSPQQLARKDESKENQASQPLCASFEEEPLSPKLLDNKSTLKFKSLLPYRAITDLGPHKSEDGESSKHEYDHLNLTGGSAGHLPTLSPNNQHIYGKLSFPSGYKMSSLSTESDYANVNSSNPFLISSAENTKHPPPSQPDPKQVDEELDYANVDMCRFQCCSSSN